jgi:hypothetical protein
VIVREAEEGVWRTNHVLLPWVDHGLIPQLLDGHKDAYSVADFLDPHFLQDLLVAIDEVVSIEIIGCAMSASINTPYPKPGRCNHL